MKILLFSRYGSRGASSRVRYLQYIAYFKSHNVRVSVYPLFSNRYIEAMYSGKKAWGEVFSGYFQRVAMLLTARKYDVVILEKELFPFLPALAEKVLRLFGVHYLVDFDDALFHRYDQHSNRLVRVVLHHKIDAVMRHASVVVVGNQYLASRAVTAGAQQVTIVPTVVDVERYRPKNKSSSVSGLIVGWIGTPKTSHYLLPLISVFQQLKRNLKIRFMAVGAKESDFCDTVIESISWTEETEVSLIQEFDIGIMPLTNSLWEHGKCGYKLIQYMACGVPVVASPVGISREIVISGVNGYLAGTNAEWLKSLEKLITMDVEMRIKMGVAGRQVVENNYSISAQAPRLMESIRRAAV